MDPIILRAGERILAVFIGGLSMFLGYHLFLNLPNPTTDSEGKVMLPGGISIYLSRVGPGVFFALFGAIVVGMSFRYSIRYSKEEGTRDGAKETKEKYVGFGGTKAPANPRDLELERQLLHM